MGGNVLDAGGGIKRLYPLFLIVALLAVGVFYFGSGDDLTETLAEEVATSDVAEPAPTLSPAPVVAPTEPEAAGSSDETESDNDPFAPLIFHIDVLPEGEASSEQHFGSFYQIWMDAETEGDTPRFAVPGITRGSLNVSFDFVATTMSGSFDLFYDQLPTDDENYESLCPGSPEAFYGIARGAFVDLPVVPAPTSETPPSNWGRADEDWYPRNEGDWYVGTAFPLDLAMSGTISNGCAELDGELFYNEFPFDEIATVEAWIDSSINIYRNQGADRVTRTEVRLGVTTVDGGDANPDWQYSFWWSDEPDRPIPDPLEE